MGSMKGFLIISNVAILVRASQNMQTTCLPAAWLPEGTVPPPVDDCLPYDGSLVPDCTQFTGQVNTTSFYHVHEWDCGLFWECGPKDHGKPSLCLFKCADCNVGPDCPDGRLQFDCRYEWPEGPVCDWPRNVGCNDCLEGCAAANCPLGENCDVSTECKCSDCRYDADCSGGQVCCNRNCADSCDSSSSSTATPTPTPCPNECCADADCTGGEECVDGSCKCPDHYECCENSDCPAGYDCVDNTCQCSTECCEDSECPEGQTCIDGSCTTTTPATTTTTTKTTTTKTTTTKTTTTTITTPCQEECCADSDCPEGYQCEDGSCWKSCSSDSECEGFDAICNHPQYNNCQYCSTGLCKPGCAGDTNCPSDHPLCSGIHNCGAGFPGLLQITASTFDCTDCSDGSMQNIEGGLILTLNDPSSLTCTSNGLDNIDKIDYTNGKTANFLANEEDGLGGCEYANLNFHIAGGSVTWTGSGKWTGTPHNPLCFYFYDAVAPFYMIYNCCDLEESGLAQGESTSLTNCRMCVYGEECD